MSSNTSLKGEDGIQSAPKRDADVLIEDLAAKGHAVPFNMDSLDPKAEARLVRKIDWHIVPVVALLYRRLLSRCSLLQSPRRRAESSAELTFLHHPSLPMALFAPQSSASLVSVSLPTATSISSADLTPCLQM